MCRKYRQLCAFFHIITFFWLYPCAPVLRKIKNPPKVRAMDIKSENQTPQFLCKTQYLQDLSFECITPAANLSGESPQNIDMQLGVGVYPVEDEAELFRVFLEVKATGQSGEKTLFIVEAKYEGHFLVKNIAEQQRDALLHVEAPALLYPFLRHILMAAIADGGYRPPMFEPVSFMALYQQRHNEKASLASAETQGTA